MDYKIINEKLLQLYDRKIIYEAPAEQNKKEISTGFYQDMIFFFFNFWLTCRLRN